MVAGKGLRKTEKKVQENFSYAPKGLPGTLVSTPSPLSLLLFFLTVTDVVLISHEGEKVSPEGGKKGSVEKKRIKEEAEARTKQGLLFPFATSSHQLRVGGLFR